MRRRGSALSLEEFHHAVNVTFHEYESEIYDSGHQNMWRSLPAQFDLLSQDILQAHPQLPDELRLLDIGCGTGLASDCLLKTPLGKRIRHITLLDTSPSMLKRATERSAGWPAPATPTLGEAQSLVGKARFEVIVTCSVLHHVLDLPRFFRTVRDLQAPQGVFLHLQDPNGDYSGDPELTRRFAENSRRAVPEWLSRLKPSRVAARLKREIAGQQGQDYISKTNRTLLEKGVISEPLQVNEIYAITDVHADHGDNQGISIKTMRGVMTEYECLTVRSYSFFGPLWSELPPDKRKMEEQLIADKAPNGCHVAAAWRLIAGQN